MRHLLLLFIVFSCLATVLPGCEPKESMVQTSGKLDFDRDTVLFDTVFTTVRTVTKRLWVYNRNSGAVRTDIALAGSQGATYSLIINGDVASAKAGVVLRGGDSLLVLVRAVLGDNGQTTTPKQFLVTDQLNFLTNGNAQNVKLVAYGQNAYFHRADIIRGNVTWRNDKPHVIINSDYVQGGTTVSVGVAVLGTLHILPGTRVYCHAGATVQVSGSLRINENFRPNAGDTIKSNNRNIVRFQGDRPESQYADVPGQWGGIFFTESSRNNVVRYCDIKNANFGLELLNPGANMPRPDLTVENCTIRNISGANPAYAAVGGLPGALVNVGGTLTATNCLLTNCGEYAVLGLGGETNLNFCTVANYFQGQAQRQTPSVFFTNAISTASGTSRVRTDVRVWNSIIWGSAGVADELLFENSDAYYPANAANGSVSVYNCLIRSREYTSATDAPDKPGLANPTYRNLLNASPTFLRSPDNGGSPYNFGLDVNSPALNRNPPQRTLPLPVPPVDLLNLRRDLNQPDLGALERP